MATSAIQRTSVASKLAIVNNTTNWNLNRATAYKMGNLVFVMVYVQGTPTSDATISTGLPPPIDNLITEMGSPSSLVSINNNGILYITSAGTGNFIGGAFVYCTNN